MREKKGKSLIALPERFVVLDVETTGYDPRYDSIIEAAALRYDRGSCESFAALVKPSQPEWLPEGVLVDPDTETRTGITTAMLRDAKQAEQVIPRLLDFIGDNVVVGHNVNFDVNFVYDAAATLGMAFSNDFVDTLRVARKMLPERQHHRLEDVAAALAVPQPVAHRALADCETTLACYLELRRRILAKTNESDFVALFDQSNAKSESRVDAFLKGTDLSALVEVEDSPIFGRVVVFTGALERMPRAAALELVAKLGGIPADSLTKKTNILVVGNAEFAKTVKNGKTSKMRKAEEYAKQGADVITISEDSFFDLIDQI